MSAVEAYESSSDVVRVRVLSTESMWADGPSGIISIIKAAVEETLKGAARTKIIEIHQPGGRVGELVQRVHGYPTFKAGERAILFLTQTKQGSFSVTGMFQGKYIVEKDGGGIEIVRFPVAGAGTTIVPLSSEKAPEGMPLNRFIEFIKAVRR